MWCGESEPTVRDHIVLCYTPELDPPEHPDGKLRAVLPATTKLNDY
jgi:hypothetical protein